MARDNSISFSSSITLVCIFVLISSSVCVRRARVLAIHPYLHTQENPISRIYDTSKYGLLQLANGLAQTPQMGWNSWNFFACNINETVIKETGEMIAGPD
ncbi:hypothetical protein Leryth_006954 [Lithospermum erythrorhizon]|nr:hypothetical protein Leryth_006954 [Lithospermum erythrorhizon]